MGLDHSFRITKNSMFYSGKLLKILKNSRKFDEIRKKNFFLKFMKAFGNSRFELRTGSVFANNTSAGDNSGSFGFRRELLHSRLYQIIRMGLWLGTCFYISQFACSCLLVAAELYKTWGKAWNICNSGVPNGDGHASVPYELPVPSRIVKLASVKTVPSLAPNHTVRYSMKFILWIICSEHSYRVVFKFFLDYCIGIIPHGWIIIPHHRVLYMNLRAYECPES